MTTPGTAIEFTLPLGRYHATAAGTTVNEAVVEWPPSVWRMLRAFVSVWKRRTPELDEATVLRTLDALCEPCAYWVPAATRAHTRHYLVGDMNNTRTGVATFLTLDPFISCKRDAHVVASWPNVSLTDDERSALRAICSRMTYLGRAESLCDARLLEPDEELPAFNVGLATSDTGNTIRLLVPNRPLAFDDLCVNLEALRSDSKRRATMPPSAHFATYEIRQSDGVPYKKPQPKSPRATAVRFRLVSMAPGRRVVRPSIDQTILYTTVLREACQSRFGKDDAASSSTLSGRVADELARGHRHAHYLPILDATDRIESLIVWAPAGLDDELEAVMSIRRLTGWEWLSDFRPVGLALENFGAVEDVAPELVGPARKFSSLTPAVPGRHPARSGRTWEQQLELELRNAWEARGGDLEAAITNVAVEAWQRPRLRTTRPRRDSRRTRHGAYPHPHRVTITFDRDVHGPLCLGALSHFGLGLFEPVLR